MEAALSKAWSTRTLMDGLDMAVKNSVLARLSSLESEDASAEDLQKQLQDPAPVS